MSVRFSVLIPVYNRANYVRQAIDSVLSQSFTDYEVIVVDDGSTDETPKVLESYGTRIKVFRQPNRGVEAARIQAAALARGEYLCMLDSDDLFSPYALATFDRILRDCDSPPLVLSAMTVFEGDEPPLGDARAPSLIKIRKYPDFLSKDEPTDITDSKIVIRRSLYDEIGGYGCRDGRRTDRYLDHNFILKAGTHGPCIIVQEPFTLVRRMHATNFVQNFEWVIDGILSLARAEREGLYPGGKDRRGSRYAFIGGFACWWATTRFLRSKPRLALRLLWGTAPMVVVAIWSRALRRFRKPAPLIVLPALELSGSPEIQAAEVHSF